MNISSLSIQGWRSFTYDEPIKLEGLKKINIVIGTNNSGKSNIFRYLFHLRQNIKEILDEKELIIDNYGVLNNLNSSFDTTDTWSWEEKDIIFKVNLEGINNIFDSVPPPELHKEKDILLKAHHKSKENLSCYSTLYEENFSLLEEFKGRDPKVLDTKSKKYVNHLEESKYLIDTVSYWKMFIESLVFIDPIRHHSREKSVFNESDFDGSDTVQKIINLKNEKDLEWRSYQKCLENWLKLILLEDIKLDPTDRKLRFYITRGSQEISASLENLGTGVSQLVMLLSYLYLNRERKLNIFIEEPESNLHPEAVVQLVKIMENNFTNHHFFITTHSSTLLDQLNDKWSIHRVYRKKDNSSKVVPCSEVLTQYSLLDELGIRPSKMLQSNLVIWIEGPSDRIYLNKWISDNSELLEGKHYSFLMYGGANLASYDFIDSDEYINILKTSRYSYIVCDSDKKNKDTPLKKRVQNLINRITSTTINDDQELGDYVKVWVTDGREIENYIPSSLLEEVLFSDEFLRRYIYVNQTRSNLKKRSDDNKFNEFDSFDVFCSKKYVFDNDSFLNEKQQKSISDSLSQKKGTIAKRIVESWRKEHYTETLKRDIGNLIKHIRKANNLN